MTEFEHRGVGPRVDATAVVAPTAAVVGDVEIGRGTRIGYGVVITAESGPVRIGADVIVMDNAVLRGTARHPLHLGDRVLVGPLSSLSGCSVADDVFVATGASVFNGAVIGPGAEVRIGGIVHLCTRLEPGAVVPIGWVAVGDPALIAPPDRHDEIWAHQRPLDFPGEVFGVDRPADGEHLLATVAPRYAAALGRWHRDDRPLGGGG
ncbi:MAG: gamma carbonic anhydrase family protein [Actinomycetota bacterium]|nr:gamma carbonic anhydrase family protein [Actinomycetota bacterium]